MKKQKCCRTLWVILGLLGGFGWMMLYACHKHDGHNHPETNGKKVHQEHKTSEGHAHSTGETISTLVYSESIEMFTEFSPLVAGKKAKFVAYMTMLGKQFQPVKQGQLSVDFIRDGRVVRTFVANKVSVAGIFKPHGKAPPTGDYQLSFHLRTPTTQNTLIVKKATVYPTVVEARKANPKETTVSEEISFSKEQQWNIPFATEVIATKTLHEGLSLWGEIQAFPDDHVRVTAAMDGRITKLNPKAWEGNQVNHGDFLLSIEPMLLGETTLPQLNQEVELAQSSVEFAQEDFERLQKMMRSQAMAHWQIRQARFRLNEQKIRLKTAQARLNLFQRSRKQRTDSKHAVDVRSPVGGNILRRLISPDMFVTRGQLMFEIVSLQKMRALAHLPEHYVHQAPHIRSAIVEWKTGSFLVLPKPQAIGAVIHPVMRTLPLFFPLPNPGFWRHGQSVSMRINLRPRTVLALPRKAVVDDQGVSTVFVQAQGESFVKKQVTLGIEEQGWVEIQKGLDKGERVVIEGAYEILLRSVFKNSSSTGHGHAH